MDVWSELLGEIGIQIDLPKPLPDTEPVAHPLARQPHHYLEDKTAVFTTDQIDWWGQPSEWGFTEKYIVIAAQPDYATDWAYEQGSDTQRRIHRYSRSERFRFILNQLIGQGPTVPSHVLGKLNINHTTTPPGHNKKDSYILARMAKMRKTKELIIDRWMEKRVEFPDAINLNEIPRDEIWEHVRGILKRNGMAKYYNRIPTILSLAKYDRGHCNTPTNSYQLILEDFEKLDYIFPRIKDDINRRYFPSLRYIAHRLMQKHSVLPDWQFTVIRTNHKRAELDTIYNVMWEAIRCEECMTLFDL